jgi:hypothetical protein
LIFEFTGMVHIFIHDPAQCEQWYGDGLTLSSMVDNLVELFFWNGTCPHLQVSVIRCLTLIRLFEKNFPHRSKISDFLERASTPEQQQHHCSYVEDHLKVLRDLPLA